MDNLLQVMAIITEETASQNMAGMWATVITGLVVVFLILALLIFLLSIISWVSRLGEKREKKNEPEVKAAPAPTPAAPVIEEAVIEEEEDDAEIIAVISAAIAAYSAQDGNNYVVKRIKRSEKQPRSSWGNAGVQENTRPF